MKKLIARLAIAVIAVFLTATFFLVLPIIQAITKPPSTDTIVRSADVVSTPDEEPEIEEQAEEEPEPEEEEPPELEEQETDPIDLSALEAAINSNGAGSGWSTTSLDIDISGATKGPDAGDALFSLADLDQKPRVIYQPGPLLDAKIRKKAPGTVYVLFIVDSDGKVKNPIVQSSPDPVFERPALSAVKKWKFEPGKRNGKPVSFRMRVPITFPKA